MLLGFIQEMLLSALVAFTNKGVQEGEELEETTAGRGGGAGVASGSRVMIKQNCQHCYDSNHESCGKDMHQRKAPRRK